MSVGRTIVSGSPYVGVYLKAGERGAIAAPTVPAATVREVERLLGVPVLRTTIADTEIVGALIAMNSHGIIADHQIDDQEIAVLEKLAPVLRLRSRQNAIGNNILANDTGALVHPEFGDEAVERIGKALGVPALRGTLAGLGTVGMAGIATTKGVVVHPRTTPKEAEVVEALLGVPLHRSTANFGVPVVGACLIANSRAFITGRPTTPVEIVHLQEGLAIFD